VDLRGGADRETVVDTHAPAPVPAGPGLAEARLTTVGG
jgi:hypothetical protein